MTTNSKLLQSLIRLIVKETIDVLDAPKGWISEGVFHENKEWIMYEGEGKITTIFQDNSRLAFEVRYPGVWGPDREKWKHKAASKWKSVAREIYNSQGLTEVGNPIVKPWKDCYKEALDHPLMKEFIKKKHAPVFDPVNFTQTG